MSIGKIFYKLFYHPTLFIRYHLKHFGLLGWIRMLRGERLMKKAAINALPIHLTTDNKVVSLCFLSGDRYWHQTIYAIKSLHDNFGENFRVNIYSDGTLKEHQAAIIKRFVPTVQITPVEAVVKYLDQVLPEEKYPVLRSLRNWHPFFLRMIDIHCTPGWSVHLDSDMLFFKRPDHIIDAFNQRKAIYMVDPAEESHFVDKALVLKEKYGINCLTSVNGGIIAYDNDIVDYTDLEQKAGLLMNNYPEAGPARMEQTLMSYLLYRQNAEPLDKKTYSIHYDSKIYVSDDDIVRHYIFKAKLPYFQDEWKKISL
jgi:hypothetical protein